MSRSDNLAAYVAADRMLDDLELAKDAPVDVFAAIELLSLELAIVPLDGLMGAMLPQGDGGILVTSERNARLQRYTAAHEIGHWVLHRVEPAMDTEAEILRTTTEREHQAQLFAGYFLMPPPLVDLVLARYDLRGHRIEPEHVYLASRDMQVSYEAAALRLRAAKVITRADLADLTAVDRLDALRRQFGRRPGDGNADMWQQQYSPNPKHLKIIEGDEIVIDLPENRTSGWQWLDNTQLRQRAERVRRLRPRPPELTADTVAVATQPAPSLPTPDRRVSVEPDGEHHVRVVTDEFLPAAIPAGLRALVTTRRHRAASSIADAVSTEGPAVGGTGRRSVVLRGDTPGDATLRLHYTHAYDPTVLPALTYQLTVGVQPTPNTAYHLQRIRSADLDLRRDDDPDDHATYPVVVS